MLGSWKVGGYRANIGRAKTALPFLFSVYSIPQFPRAYKSHNLPWPKHHRINSSRIPAFTLIFLFNTEFTKIRDQHILIGCHSAFVDFKKGFYNLNYRSSKESFSKGYENLFKTLPTFHPSSNL